MSDIKKGADVPASTPDMDKTMAIKIRVNYNRLVNLCLAISFTAIVVFMVGYVKNNDRLVFFGLGMMFGALLMHFGLNPIKEDE